VEKDPRLPEEKKSEGLVLLRSLNKLFMEYDELLADAVPSGKRRVQRA
jgi:hypothetical protein